MHSFPDNRAMGHLMWVKEPNTIEDSYGYLLIAQDTRYDDGAMALFALGRQGLENQRWRTAIGKCHHSEAYFNLGQDHIVRLSYSGGSNSVLEWFGTRDGRMIGSYKPPETHHDSGRATIGDGCIFTWAYKPGILKRLTPDWS